jgi:hypothetical protein
MSKMKISFSFLLTLMLVAMFSIVASAAGSNPVGTIGGKTADPADVQNGLAPDDATHDNGISVRERVVRLFLYNHLVGRAIVSEWQAVTFNLFLSRCLTMYSIDHI